MRDQKIMTRKKKIQSSGCAQSKLQPEKKGTVVWPAMFFEPPEKITTRKKGTRSTPITRCKIFFSSSVLFLRRPLVPRQEGLLTRDWSKKSPDHGSRRLLPPALPMGWWSPNQVHPPHPHIMGGNACVWFGRPTRPG
jgi:hypothetical protein